MKTTRLKGHSLPREGKVYRDGLLVKDGHAECSCGARSEESFDSANQRQRWHAGHKLAVSAGAR